MNGNRKRRLALTVGLSLAFLVAAAIAAFALSDGHDSPGSRRARAATAGSQKVVEAAAGTSASGRQSDAGSGDGNRVAARQDGSANSHEDISRPVPDEAHLAALERAVGRDPRNLKTIPWIPNRVRVKRGEALPCTGEEEPINFEIFSAGPSVEGLPVTDYARRCDEAAPADEDPANFTNYIYGECVIAPDATGCQPPLEIQSFPACQRSLGDYTLEGRPLPYKELGRIGEAVVVEINLLGEPRIEVYTGSTTIVIFATELALAEQALAQLTPQQAGEPPADSAGELKADPDPSLAAPTDGAIQGELSCRS
jgi:hypothetical protein